MPAQHATTAAEYREIPEWPGYRVGSDGSFWSRWARRRRAAWRGGFEAYQSEVWERLRLWPNKSGYLLARVKHGRKAVSRPLHRIVLEQFVGPKPAGRECRHLNGIKTDNRLENLAWGTAKENTEDKRRHGTMSRESVNRGSAHGNAKLTEAGVFEMRALRAEGVSVREIAVRFGIHVVHAYAVLRGESWPHCRPPTPTAAAGATAPPASWPCW